VSRKWFHDPEKLRGDLRRLHKSGGLPRGDSTGWRAVDELYTVGLSQWTIVTGIPQSGKSEFLDAMLINLAEAGGWHFTVFSPENNPVSTHLAKLVEKRARKPFGNGPTARMTEDEADEAAAWVLEHFAFLTGKTGGDDDYSPESLIGSATAWPREGVKRGIVLDPWNTLDHQRGGLSETDYVSVVLTHVTKIVRQYNAHCWLVVHPAKIQKDREGKRPVPTPYDISGSAHWYNKADNIITVHREQGTDSQDVEIHVQKVRFKHIGHIGMAMLKFDKVTGRYFEFPSVMDRFTGRPERLREIAG
jgi:twinkle protein